MHATPGAWTVPSRWLPTCHSSSAPRAAAACRRTSSCYRAGRSRTAAPTWSAAPQQTDRTCGRGATASGGAQGRSRPRTPPARPCPTRPSQAVASAPRTPWGHGLEQPSLSVGDDVSAFARPTVTCARHACAGALVCGEFALENRVKEQKTLTPEIDVSEFANATLWKTVISHLRAFAVHRVAQQGRRATAQGVVWSSGNSFFQAR